MARLVFVTQQVDPAHPALAATVPKIAAVARRVEEGGRFWISTTELKGRTWFRINPVNFRTRPEHMDELLALLEEECERARTAAV
jgi:hypothetical protein